ncbi:ankyrin repeat-containing domain protein [Aspergillus insuetus]
MHLLELPLEIFHAILAHAIPTDRSWPYDFTQLQLVNKTFAREAREVLFATRTFRYGNCWNTLGNHYLCHRALAPDANILYATRTVRQTTDWIAAEQATTNWKARRSICSSLSRLATCHYRPIVHETLTESPHGVGLRERTEGLGQSSNAAEHRLCAAAYLGNMTLAQSLLSQGVDINEESDIFGLPLLSAAYGGHLKLVLFLLEKGADLNGGVIQGDTEAQRRDVGMFTSLSQGWTALEAATAGGHEAIVRLLLDSNIGTSYYSSCSFFTAIIHAARWGRKNILQILLDRADFAAIPEDLKTGILDTAASESASNGRIDTLTLLLDAGAQVNRWEKLQDGPLWYAAINGQNEVIKVLLERGADIDEGCLRPRDSPLVMAAHYGFPRTVALLLDRGAEVNDTKGMRPLRYIGTTSPHWCVLKVMLEKGVHKRDEEAAADVLEDAYNEDRQDLVDLLLEYGVTLSDTAE